LFAALLVGPHPIRRSVDGDDHAAVQQPVQQAGGEHRVGQPFTPGGDAGMAGEDGGGLQVAAADHFEQGGVGFRVRAVSGVGELVDHQQPRAAEEPHCGGPASFQRGASAAFGQLGGGGEVDPMPGGDRRAGEADREHGLAGAGLTDEQDVAGVVEEAQRREFADEFFVHAGLGGEVELVDAVGRGQRREPQQPGMPTRRGGRHLDAQ
jgi:hypothetical protein